LNFLDATKESWKITKNRIIEIISFNISLWLIVGIFFGLVDLIDDIFISYIKYNRFSITDKSTLIILLLLFIALNIYIAYLFLFKLLPWMFMAYIFFYKRLVSPIDAQEKEIDSNCEIAINEGTPQFMSFALNLFKVLNNKLIAFKKLVKSNVSEERIYNSNDNNEKSISLSKAVILIASFTTLAVIVTVLFFKFHQNENTDIANVFTNNNFTLSSKEESAAFVKEDNNTGFSNNSTVNSENKVPDNVKQKNTINSIMIVDTKVGLVMRKEPSTSSKKIIIIPYGDEVKVIERQLASETINGITSNWIKVNWKKYTAWVFGGYLKEKDSTL